jgi:hypothetical protein
MQQQQQQQQLSSAAKAGFEEGVGLVFSQWTALVLAVENEWGGHDSAAKADYLIDDTIQWFYRKKGARVCLEAGCGVQQLGRGDVPQHRQLPASCRRRRRRRRRRHHAECFCDAQITTPPGRAPR